MRIKTSFAFGIGMGIEVGFRDVKLGLGRNEEMRRACIAATDFAKWQPLTPLDRISSS